MPKNNSKNLSVPDASTRKEFEKNAGKAWEKAHPEKRKRRGRPSQNAEVFEGLNALIVNEHLKGKKLNLYNLKKAWKEQFPDLVWPSEDTIHTWAEIWLQMVKLKMILGEKKFMPFWKHVGALYSSGEKEELNQYLTEMGIHEKMEELNVKLDSTPI
jgi:hypothetical protein